MAELTAQLSAEAEQRFEDAKSAWQDAETKRLSATVETQKAREDQRISVEVSKIKAEYEERVSSRYDFPLAESDQRSKCSRVGRKLAICRP